MAKTVKKVVKKDANELMQEMRTKGTLTTIPYTGREIRVKTLDAVELLESDKLPNILTPLVVKTVYTEVEDAEIKKFLDLRRDDVQDALAMGKAINFICEKSITDGTKVENLTMAEKRWIFRLAVGPAEFLVPFRDEEESDVEPVEDGNTVREAAE